MSAWLGVSPLIGAGSLDGFAIGALASGACFLAIAAPRRARKRRAVALGDGLASGPGPGDGWLCEHVRAAEAFPAEAERLVEPDMSDVDPNQPGHGLGETPPAGQACDGPGLTAPAGDACDGLGGTTAPGTSPGWRIARGRGLGRVGQAFLASRGDRTSGSYRSRHRRLGGSIRGSTEPRRRFGGASARAAFPDSGPYDDELLGSAARPPELAFPDGTFGSSKRPQVRSLPRHAAPGVSLSSRLSTGVSTVITGLSATRAMLGGAQG
jgi:hypothetical protein